MPRKPTVHARRVEAALRRQFAGAKGELPWPTVRQLAGRFDISYSTISRIFNRFVQESLVWQHPNRRFYPAAARRQIVKALPIVVLGRQIGNWSVLYREILEGVSEICSARGCPLVFLSSDKLLRHDNPEHPPVFAGRAMQERELARLIAGLPKPYGGILFDHLWDDRLVAQARRAHPSSVILVRECTPPAGRDVAVNVQAAAEMIAGHLASCGYQDIVIALPFEGDQAVDAARQAVETELAGKPCFEKVRAADCSTPQTRRRMIAGLRRSKRRTAVVSLEDNITSLLWRALQGAGMEDASQIGLASVQGTAALGAPITRLRFDYRRLGREAASSLLSGNAPVRPMRPVLVRGRTAAPERSPRGASKSNSI